MNKQSIYGFINGVVNGFVASIAFKAFSIEWIVEVLIYATIFSLYTASVRKNI